MKDSARTTTSAFIVSIIPVDVVVPLVEGIFEHVARGKICCGGTPWVASDLCFDLIHVA
jgi:hypothetical protein